jgi:hypothetical protein
LKFTTTTFSWISREFLTEKQLEQNGPILIDLDLKYSSSVVKEYTRKTTCSTLYVFGRT